MHYTKIKKITKIGKRQTHDLKVDTINNYTLANGVIVHNSGKSVKINTLAQEYKNHGYKVIYLTSKQNSPWDCCYGLFPPDQEYHTRILESMQVPIPKTTSDLDPVEILHPFTFKIPKNKKLPKIKFFTLPLKSINEIGFSTLFSKEEDEVLGVRVCANAVKKLKPDQSVWHFLHQVYLDITSKRNKISYDPEDLFIPVKVGADTKTLSIIRDAFKPLREDLFITESTHPLCLDVKAMLNDQKTTSVFITPWVKEKRMRFFLYIQILKVIEEILESGHAKHPILIVLEEVKVLLPKTGKTAFEKNLIKVLREALSTFRTLGKGCTILASTQNYFEISPEFVGSCNARFFGKISFEDEKALITDFRLKTMQLEHLREQEVGEFTWMEELNKNNEVKITVDMPSFKHPESSDDFIQLYRKHYPDSMQTYNEQLKTMMSYRENLEKVMKERLKEIEKKMIEDEDKQDKKKSKRSRPTKENQMDTFVDQVAVLKESQKWETYIKCYDMAGSGMSWTKIAKELGINHSTAKKYAYVIAKDRGDRQFVLDH